MSSGVNRLLVVDGNAADIDRAARTAADAGFAFAAASVGPEFPTLVDAFRPTVILIDCDAATAAGGGLLAVLAARGSIASVVLAGGAERLASAAQLARTRGLRVAGTIAKPLLEPELLALLTAAARPVRALSAEELARGVAAGELVPFFQPQARSAQTGEWIVDGVEALVRWPHGQHGLVMPDEFVPLAERTGLIGPLTERVIAASLAELERWNAAGLRMRCAVNLPPSLVTDAALPERLARLLEEHGLDASQLELEVTETATMREPTAALDVLTRVRALGVGVSLDDFGIGYSSLTRLHELPFDEMKIDKSLVVNLPHSRQATTLVGSLIELGHNLGLEVCAEGVESRAALDLLEALRCDRCQGYYLSRALPAAEIHEFVARFNEGGAPSLDVRRAGAATRRSHR